MMIHNLPSPTGGQVTDYSLAAGFITSPAWLPSLAQVNEWIPLASFVVGVGIALVRLRLDVKRAKEIKSD